MRLKEVRLGWLLIISVLFITYSTGWSAKQLETENIHLRGSSNVAVIAQLVAESYMRENPGVIVTVSSMGSMRGIKCLIDATSNIAMASADSDEELEKRAKDNDVTLTKHIIAYDALVPIVNHRNTATNLTMEQLRQLFSGEITNWQQLGGVNEPVVIVSNEGNSGNYATWKEKVMQTGKVVTPRARFVATSDAMKKQIAQTPGAIGYIGMSYLDNSIKTLTVESISADRDNVKSNKYPLMRELALYTTQNPTAAVPKFIEYFLAGKGQQFVEQAGAIPVK